MVDFNELKKDLAVSLDWRLLPIFANAGNIDGKIETLDALAHMFEVERDELKIELDEAKAWRDDARTPSIVFPEDTDVAGLLKKGADYKTYNNTVWHDCYDAVAEWLADNRHKGILIAGGVGAGKTMIADAISVILEYKTKFPIITKKVDARDLAAEIKDESGFFETLPSYGDLQRRALFVDDLGTETETAIKGQKMLAFQYVVENLGGGGDLLILTTNLNAQEFKAKYGARTQDRLRQLVTCVNFDCESMRDTWQCEAEQGKRNEVGRRFIPNEGRTVNEINDKTMMAEHVRNYRDFLAWAAENTPNVAQRMRPDDQFTKDAWKGNAERKEAILRMLEKMNYDGGDLYKEIERIYSVIEKEIPNHIKRENLSKW